MTLYFEKFQRVRAVYNAQEGLMTVTCADPEAQEAFEGLDELLEHPVLGEFDVEAGSENGVFYIYADDETTIHQLSELEAGLQALNTVLVLGKEQAGEYGYILNVLNNSLSEIEWAVVEHEDTNQIAIGLQIEDIENAFMVDMGFSMRGITRGEYNPDKGVLLFAFDVQTAE